MPSPDLDEHQRKAANELSNGKILCGGTGSGKTRTAFAYYAKVGASRDIVVITTAKKRDSLDWEEEALRWGIGKEKDATFAGTITVDSWNNLGKHSSRTGCFFIFDEQRLVGGGAWTKAFYKIAKENDWILLSATPGDTWLDYIPVFVANGFYKNRTDFVREHVVYAPYVKFPKVQRYVGVGQLIRQRNQLLVDMPYKKHTERKMYDVSVDYDVDQFEKAVKTRWDPYKDEPIRDVAGLCRTMRRIVNSDQSRVEAVKNLLVEHKRLIVFYNFDYELEQLKRALTEEQEVGYILGLTDPLDVSLPLAKRISESKLTMNYFEIAEWNGHKHEEIPKTESWVYLVNYQAGAEAWNCVETDAMCFYSLTYSYRNFSQSQGRIDRRNTPFKYLHYYILKSDSMIDKLVWKSLLAKKDFNEREITEFAKTS